MRGTAEGHQEGKLSDCPAVRMHSQVSGEQGNADPTGTSDPSVKPKGDCWGRVTHACSVLCFRTSSPHFRPVQSSGLRAGLSEAQSRGVREDKGSWEGIGSRDGGPRPDGGGGWRQGSRCGSRPKAVAREAGRAPAAASPAPEGGHHRILLSEASASGCRQASS